MAARVDAVALNCNVSWANPVYSRQDLISIGFRAEQAVNKDFIHSNGIPECIARTPGAPWIVIPAGRKRRRRRERRQKRGCRAGVLLRLKQRQHTLPLPSIFLSNARSIANKMDELKLQIAANNIIQDCCILLITETWLHSSIPDTAIEITGRTAHRYDRNSDSGKNRGGGLCIYVNNDWCTSVTTIDSHCSPDLEYLTIKCRPKYLPREFTVVMVTVVYIAPNANANSALSQLYNAISLQQNTHPEAVHLIAGDFNHAHLKVVLPKFHQHINCATRGGNTLDKAYSNIKHGYKTKQLPHLGTSDHMSLLLIPAYTTIRKKRPPSNTDC